MTHHQSPSLDISRQTSGSIPVVPFSKIKNAVLGDEYELSLVFPTTKLASKLHLEHEGKSGPANILSFPYEKNSGEIFMHLGTLRKEASVFNHSYLEHLKFMFIHGCAHLAGYDHGPAMDKFESRFRQQFGLVDN